MATVRDVVAYICKHYPYKHELSNARLTKMIYLADWRSAINRRAQLTPIEWRFNHYEPWVEDVIEAIRNDPEFEVVFTTNFYGEPKLLVRAKDDVTYPTVTDADREVLDFVIATTAPKYWNDFIRLVYSTFPIVTQPRYTTLDLVALAAEYEQGQAQGLFG